MKITQPRGMKIWLVFTIMSSLQPLPSCAGQIDVETQTDPTPLGPPPEQYQEWSELRELFDKAVVDEVWSIPQFYRAVASGAAHRKNCIDEEGILHLIKIDYDWEEEPLNLAHAATLLPNADSTISGFRLTTRDYSRGPPSLPTNIKFELCDFRWFESEPSDRPSIISNIEFNKCDFRYCLTDSLAFRQKVTFTNSISLPVWPSYEDHITFFYPAEFKNCDLDYRGFCALEFKDFVSITNCNFSNGVLRSNLFDNGAHFENCNFCETVCKYNVLHNVQFIKCNFSTNKPSELRYIKYGGKTIFSHCNLYNRTLIENEFYGPVHFADFANSKTSFIMSKFYSNAHFIKCNLSNSSFEGSAFEQKLILNNCSFSETNFERTMINEINIKGHIPYNTNFTGAHIINTPILLGCTVKLAGSRYFDPDSDPFPSAFLVTGQVKLQYCKDPLGNPIQDCDLHRAPYFKNLAWARRRPNTDHNYYFE